MKRYDLATLASETGKKVTGIIVSGASGNVDSLVMVMDRSGRCIQRYPDAVTCEGVYVRGQQLLNREQAELRAEIERHAKSELGRQAIDRARARPDAVERTRRGKRTVERIHHDTPLEDRMPTAGHAGPLTTDPPLRLSTPVGAKHMDDAYADAFDKYLAVRDPAAHPRDLTPEAHEVRYLDALKARNERYYRVYVALLLERRSPTEVADLLRVNMAHLRVMKQRAVAAYAEIAAEGGPE